MRCTYYQPSPQLFKQSGRLFDRPRADSHYPYPILLLRSLVDRNPHLLYILAVPIVANFWLAHSSGNRYRFIRLHWVSPITDWLVALTLTLSQIRHCWRGNRGMLCPCSSPAPLLTTCLSFRIHLVLIGECGAVWLYENADRLNSNDLNLDHFTHNIVRAELASITSVPVPDPAVWCFCADNNSLFSNDGKERTLEPELWVQQGVNGIRRQLAKATGDLSRDEEEKEKKASIESNKKGKKNKSHGNHHDYHTIAGDPGGDE
jgi:hypothetical protein